MRQEILSNLSSVDDDGSCKKIRGGCDEKKKENVFDERGLFLE
jgi:hypothetical protein